MTISTISTGTILVALGAILRFAITAEVPGMELPVIGNILMIAGAIIAVIGIIMLGVRGERRTEVYESRSPDGQRVVRERVDV